jgi:Domain of unknown function (DUF4260)
MEATALAQNSTAARVVWGSLAAFLLAATVFEVSTQGTGLWQAVAFGLGPDLALFAGLGANLEKGRLHPRAVGLYNLVHRLWLPLGLVLFAALGLVSLGFLVGGLAWCFHVSLDRTVGYGLRDRDGYQRA